MQAHQETPDTGNPHRERFPGQFETWLDEQFGVAEVRRVSLFQADFSSIDACAASLIPLRARFHEMLGWPLTEVLAPEVPAACAQFVAEGDLGRIERLWIEVLPGVEAYGLLFLPPANGPRPLVISQHGGGGTPELTADFFGSANYNDMTRRILRRGMVTFAPQLFRWDAKYGRQPDVPELDRQMKQLGGSIAAFEITCLKRALDYLVTRPEVDADRIGMAGLSYGGFFTLYTTAADTRIKAALSSCFFNDWRRYGWQDWSLFGAANRFFDAEVASLVCPRALYLEVGENDPLFDVESARPHVPQVRARYEHLNIADHFAYHEHLGVHEFDLSDDGIDFLCRHLDQDR